MAVDLHKDLIQAVFRSGNRRWKANWARLPARSRLWKLAWRNSASLRRCSRRRSGAEQKTAGCCAQEAVQRENEEVTPEMLVMIAAAVTAFLGKKVRIRSAKMLRPPCEVANPWSQQGRVLVHGSHHPRSRS